MKGYLLKLWLFIALAFTQVYSDAQIIKASNNYVAQASTFCNGDADVAKFLTATGITDATIKDNICWLVDTMKSTEVWYGMYAVYPFAGGTATTHAYNLIDTATYKLTFSGTVTHASTGAKGNGSTGYANTGFNPNTVWTDTLGSIGLYSRTSGVASGTVTEMGASNAAYTQNTSIFIRFGDTFYGLVNCSGIASHTGNTASDGFYMASRFSHTGTRNYIQKNATQTTFSEGAGRPNLNLYLWAINENGTAKNFSTKELTFAFIGQGFNQTNGTLLNTIVSRWNAKMGR